MNKKNLGAILFNFLVLVLGVLLILWADKVTTIVSILLGILIVLYGIVNIVNYFKIQDKKVNDTLHFAYGIFILVIGSVLIFRVDFLKQLMSFIVGIYMILSSVIKLYEFMIVNKTKKVKKAALILCLIGLLVGILCVAGKFLIPDIILKFVGYMLVIYSLVDTSNIVILGKNNE